jgi:hypothetical protein
MDLSKVKWDETPIDINAVQWDDAPAEQSLMDRLRT